METSYAVSVQNPQFVTTTATLISTTTTSDTAMETVLGALAVVLAALFLATLLVLVNNKSTGGNASGNQPSAQQVGGPSQATSTQTVGPSPALGPYCIACGTKLPQGARFCGKCGSNQPYLP